jgi:hypothetical protein
VSLLQQYISLLDNGSSIQKVARKLGEWRLSKKYIRRRANCFKCAPLPAFKLSAEALHACIGE